MRKILVTFISCAGLLASAGLLAAEPNLTVTLPRLNVAEYHSPYVAIWIEDERRQATHVALWYDVAMADQEGQEWLKDLRQWWRRGGRALSLPVDGLTGATKGPGQYSIDTQISDALTKLPAGKYRLMVEAAREVGGREVLQLPLELPLDDASLPISVKGSSEITEIKLHNKS